MYVCRHDELSEHIVVVHKQLGLMSKVSSVCALDSLCFFKVASVKNQVTFKEAVQCTSVENSKGHRKQKNVAMKELVSFGIQIDTLPTKKLEFIS